MKEENNMKTCKRWVAFLATLAMLLGLIVLPTSADEESTGKTTEHLSMTKTVWYEDEVIEITATGDESKKDWVGYNVDGNTGNSLKWWYVTSTNYGKSVNLLSGKEASADGTTLPVGNYWAYFVPANGYAKTMTETISFQVIKRPAAAIEEARPEGDGSYTHPYLISSAENLVWMANQVGSGIDPTGKVNPFEGKYFRQTADIDLNESTVYPIGYAYLDADNYAVFGGIYDGQGYKIKNGKIAPSETYSADAKHGAGLFGVIADATILNVTLENVAVSGPSVVGGIVGMSVSLKETPDESANLIEKCCTGTGCTVTATTTDNNKNNYKAPQRIGGIIGDASNTTVLYCINEGSIKANYGIKTSGGIVAFGNANVTVKNCVNKGLLEYDITGGTVTPEGQVGGIMGYIATGAKGNHLIENCYNIGEMKIISDASSATATLSFGGILGAFNTLEKGYTHEIKNCYNLTKTFTAAPLNGSAYNWRIGEIVGCGYQGGNVAAIAMQLTSCYAIGMPIATGTVTADGKASTYYAYTWYTAYPAMNYTTDANKVTTYADAYGIANYRNNKNADGTAEILFTDCAYKTEAEIKVLTDAIDTAISGATAESTMNTKVATDKRFYIEGEDILVYGTGNVSNKDWIGIKPKNDTDANGYSIYWYYLTDENLGKAVNIKNQKKSSRADSNDYNLPAGEYVVFYVPSNKNATDMTEFVEITITKTVATDRDTYYEGEPIYARGKTAGTSSKDWIGIIPEQDWDANGYSIWWYYLTDENNLQPVNLRTQGKSARADSNDYNLPAGRYKVYFVPSNQLATAMTEYIVITILAEGEAMALEAPSEVTYTLKNETDGMADGTVTVKLSATNLAKDIVMYWGNAEGKLAGYTALAKFKTNGETTVTHEMTANTVIPTGATKLLVYTASGSQVSEECYTVDLPEGSAHKGFGTPIATFQVISDIHLNSDNTHLYNTNFKKVLQDIAANGAGSSGIFINGDIANNGKAVEYENMWTIYNEVKSAGATLPNIYLSIGNHDFYGNNAYADSVELFLKNAYLTDGTTHPDKLYYDFWLNGYHYIFLGTDRYPINKVNAFLNDEQLEWLDETLAEDRESGKPVFVFLHQSLYETVAGSFEGQGWNGATPDAKIRNVLKKYPEVIFFNGHSHWSLNDDGCMYDGDEDFPIYAFNTSSTAYLWTSYNKVAGEALAGSEGYYVTIYDDCVTVMGRNFTTGEWVSSALFVAEDKEFEVEKPTEKDTGTSEQVTDEKPTGEQPTTETPTGEKITGEQATTGTGEKPVAGCKSVVTEGTFGILLMTAVGVEILRKKRNRK